MYGTGAGACWRWNGVGKQEAGAVGAAYVYWEDDDAEAAGVEGTIDMAKPDETTGFS